MAPPPRHATSKNGSFNRTLESLSISLLMSVFNEPSGIPNSFGIARVYSERDSIPSTGVFTLLNFHNLLETIWFRECDCEEADFYTLWLLFIFNLNYYLFKLYNQRNFVKKLNKYILFLFFVRSLYLYFFLINISKKYSG